MILGKAMRIYKNCNSEMIEQFKLKINKLNCYIICEDKVSFIKRQNALKLIRAFLIYNFILPLFSLSLIIFLHIEIVVE